MNHEKILSKDFLNLKDVSDKKKESYLNAKPFPNIKLDNVFNDDFLSNVLNEFPDLAKLNSSQNYNVKNEIKLSNNNYKKFPKNIKLFIDFLNSNFFLQFLQNLTSIKEKLVSDSHLEGGGLHEIKCGGVLKVHTDFNRHPFLSLDRRINVLIYLNKNWKDTYGGHLEFWNKNMTMCEKKILPTFNTMAIFSTTDFSNHGHPELLNCPEEMSRKSIALYYFSSGRPENEILNVNKKNRTHFKGRVGIKNDADEKDEYFKNFIREFKIYKILKNFEKKYIRRKKNQKTK
jgi:Rps23 Pro-64 3,4-dihydroxylase Tpa1-like proline 4-hydroxylase